MKLLKTSPYRLASVIAFAVMLVTVSCQPEAKVETSMAELPASAWEYTIAQTPAGSAIGIEANEMAKDGWYVVGIVSASENRVDILLKRPKG